jgi:hypothetical protein
MAIPANGSLLLTPTVTNGRVSVEPAPPPGQVAPAGTIFRTGVSSSESDPQVLIEARLLEASDSTVALRDTGFDFAFGQDFEGNFHDFAIQATNATPSDLSLVIQHIAKSDGTQLIAAPRTVVVRANGSKLLATTDVDSRGLEAGETSPFSDIFGDVSVSTGYQELFVHVQAPVGMDVAGRDYDSVFKSYYRIIPGRKFTNDMAVVGVEVEPTTTTGVRNWVSFMNPFSSTDDISVRAYTPGGTEYILDTLTVGPLMRFDWSPDGLVFREDPTDLTSPPVPFVSFRFTSQGGLVFSARKERRNVMGFFLSVTPHVLRNLRFE